MLLIRAHPNEKKNSFSVSTNEIITPETSVDEVEFHLISDIL